MNLKAITSAAFAVALSIGSADATTFNLTGNDSTNYAGLPSSFSLVEDGITATFKAGSFTGGFPGVNQNVPGGYTITSASFASDPRIGRYGGGAGVSNSRFDNHQVDGLFRDDFIEIVFSKAVSLAEVSFGFFGGNDDFRWMWDMNGNGSIGVGDFLSFQQDDNPFSNFGSVVSKVWAIGAFGSNDNWKLKTVTVSAIPLPATSLLLLLGVGGLGLMRRRRKVAS